MYHGQSQSKLGTDEGLVAMLGPLLDTGLVCTITGLIVIITGAYTVEGLNGIVLTLEAFRRAFFWVWGCDIASYGVYFWNLYFIYLFLLWRKMLWIPH